VVNSRDKGKRFEREAAKAITETFGVEARRGIQFKGGDTSPDIITGLRGTHFEVKAVEKLNLMEAFEQAKRDAKANIPIVMHKKNRTGWFLTMRLEDVLGFIESVKDAQASTSRSV
jgi:Holliday junction resolvase